MTTNKKREKWEDGLKSLKSDAKYPFMREFVRKVLAEQREEMAKEVRILGRNRNGRKKYFGVEPYTDQGYNRAVKDVLSLIRGEK